MLSTRGLSWRRLLALLCLGALIGVGPGRTFAAFYSTNSNPSNSFSASRIFQGQRSTSAWDVRDAADGSESDESNQRAFVDANFYKTGNWTNAWSTSRYLEFEMNSPLATGLALSDAAFSFTYADDDGAGGNQFCYYFEVRRTSTGAVLATHGSSGSPVSCETSQTMKTVATSMPSVSTTDTANDITIRLYGNHSGGGKAARVDAATITGTLYSNPFKLYSHRFVDASTGTGTTTRWGPAVSGDGASYQTVGNWSNAFAANRYLTFTFPAYVPGSGVVTAASIDHWYKSATSGDTTCWYMEVYNGTTLLATKGSTTTPISCNSTTSDTADNVSIPEIDSASKANNVVIRIYARNSGGRRTDHDLVRLNVTYSMGPTGCVNPGSQTVYANSDSYTDQNAPAANEGTNADLKVKTKPSENRRTFVSFPLPSIPTDCYIAYATLRMFQNGTQGLRTLEAYRAAASWTETGITWNNQPGTVGAAATTASGANGEWREWTVNSLVRNMYQSGNYGFVVKDQIEDGPNLELKLDSRESTNKPELVINFITYTGCDDPGSQTVTASYDSFTDQNAPTQNNATNVDLKVKAKNATEAKRAFIQFTLPSVPSGCSLTNAILRLHMNGSQGTRTIEIHRADTAWSDTTITWNNQPGLSGTPAATSVTGVGLKEWTVTSLVQEQYSGSNHGFVVKDSVEDSGGSSFEQKFNSLQEAAPNPTLVVTFG